MTITAKTSAPPAPHVSPLDQAGGLFVPALLASVISTLIWLRNRRLALLVSALTAQAIAASVLWVFRNPRRRLPESTQSTHVMAPIDGRITSVAPVWEDRFIGGAAYCIAIRVALQDIQVCRAPLPGIITYRRYEPGQQQAHGYGNDSIWLGIQQSNGHHLLLHMIAARFWRKIPRQFARSIICWPDLRDQLQAGDETGHLPFGGYIQVFVPAGAQVVVQPGQRTRGGESLLAVLPSPASGS